MRRWVLGVLASVLILVLVADAAVLVASTEVFVPVRVAAALILNPGREAVVRRHKALKVTAFRQDARLSIRDNAPLSGCSPTVFVWGVRQWL
jgi:hypothetical protein